ncbi:MAG: isoprenylcysteine carboxylmethyltransferase family protein [Candidatus Sulfotelmatobacter sp.]
MILVLLGAAAYGALAILGWGGFRAFFSHTALTALFAVLLLMSVVALFAGGNLSSGVREDRGNRWVIAVFAVIGLLDGYLPALTDRSEFWTIDHETIRWIGIVLFAMGGTFRLLPVFVLGRRFSGLVAIQPGHTLLTTGIYRFIRHPSYLGLLLTAFGWGLTFRSGVGLLLAAILVPPLVARMNSEEALLNSEFGTDYDNYRSRTSRLIPGIY